MLFSGKNVERKMSLSPTELTITDNDLEIYYEKGYWVNHVKMVAQQLAYKI